MKIKFLLFSFFAFIMSIQGQNNCDNYFSFSEGSYMKQHSYDKKGKLEGIVSHEVKALSQTDSGYEADVEMTLQEEDGEEIYQSNYQVACVDGSLVLDLSSRMMHNQAAAYTEMDVDISVESEGIMLPPHMQVGDVLEDAFYQTQIGSNGMVLMTTRIEITERTVNASETIETPAGTFDCLVLSSVMSSKVMMGSMDFQTKEWWAEGIGMVRSETYRKGKLESYSELVEYSK